MKRTKLFFSFLFLIFPLSVVAQEWEYPLDYGLVVDSITVETYHKDPAYQKKNTNESILATQKREERNYMIVRDISGEQVEEVIVKNKSKHKPVNNDIEEDEEATYGKTK